MIPEVGLFWLLLPLAAGASWWAARRGIARVSGAQVDRLRSTYFRGLNYLLNEQPDKAIEVFLQIAEVDSNTIETHLALGNLFRRRGEVDRAIRVHQNLVARPTLNAEQKTSALLELGEDYMRAGLLDRAETLFTDLVGFSTWALRAGDDLVLALLGEVNSATETVVREHGGRIVKSLGDGTMAVFTDAAAAIEAGHEVVGAVSALQVQGYRPQLRAGLHTGEPRPVDDDYLGVDVNIAARVADAAGAGELLVTKDTLTAAVGEDVDPATRFALRRRRFKAKGVPRTVEVFAAVPRYRS